MFSKCAWVVPLKDNKSIKITKVFQEMLDELRRKPNKVWEDKGIKFYNRPVQW